ncbi:hypothetical protein GCM10025868_18110 [Angustibacter aerolatus]|uniref:Carbohydrate kinase FGGY C-terminal domain-containing protein n=1 Tax=Angustibacter aerolatus TaxID=1162965 RepID=A0ABQ6JED4_9ACTN|nr:hypothetical protein GCM10025868_18110 [Angustibacter aerolatus]
MPAFSGLFAPHWRSDARGVLVGLTRFVTKGHVARAALEATAFQTREVVEAMDADSGVALTEPAGRRRHGRQRACSCSSRPTCSTCRWCARESPRRRPSARRTRPVSRSGSGRAPTSLAEQWAEDTRWEPSMGAARREHLCGRWQRAVQRTLDWADDDED